MNDSKFMSQDPSLKNIMDDDEIPKADPDYDLTLDEENEEFADFEEEERKGTPGKKGSIETSLKGYRGDAEIKKMKNPKQPFFNDKKEGSENTKKINYKLIIIVIVIIVIVITIILIVIFTRKSDTTILGNVIK